MTNSEIIARRELLGRLGDVRGKFGWYIYRNMKILSDASAEALKVRDAAIEKYGKDGKISPADDGWTAFVDEVTPVMEIEQEVHLRKLNREEFENLAETSELSAVELSIIDEVIVEG